MRRGWPVLVALVAVGLAGPARAQSVSGQLFGFGVGGKVASQITVPVRARGELVVSFRGDAAAGCAARGVCSYAGTVVVRPTGGTLSILTIRHGKRVGHMAELQLSPGQGGYITSARVQRSAPGGPGGTCADAEGSVFGASAAAVAHAGSVTVRLLARGGSLLQTRCAGPLDGDLASVSPAVTVSLARALHGRTPIDLSGTRAFAGHGFAGTLSSTLVLKLGKASPPPPSGSSFPQGIKTQRTRIVTERLSLVRSAGGLGVAVRGTADPLLCGLLDSCGLSGTLALGGVGHEVVADVVATGPANRPDRDFRTALGLARGGRSRGIGVAVFVTVLGHVQAEISQAGSTCTDTGATGAVSAAIAVSGGGPGGGGFGVAWRTRCPGPVLLGGDAAVAASLRPGALAHRQFTVRLRGRGSLTDDGYVISPSGELSAVLRRGRITSQLITEPTP